jgi:hypothetical protein
LLVLDAEHRGGKERATLVEGRNAVSLPLAAAPRGMSLQMRLLLFGVAAAVGVLAAFGWSLDASDWAYNNLLQLFVDPRIQVASLPLAVFLGFLVGFAHVFRI